jgi:hypothetical protein
METRRAIMINSKVSVKSIEIKNYLEHFHVGGKFGKDLILQIFVGI